MVEERIAAGVVVECKGKFLIVHRTKSESELNTWAIPAGTIEKGEKPIDTVVRELREETGLEVKSEDLKLIYENT